MARMKAKTAVERLRAEFPGMSSSVYSMARNPDKYGVRLTPEARRVAGFPSTNEVEQRSKPHRLVCRVSDRTWAALQEKRNGRSVQDMVETAVKQYYDIQEDENADL